jgi:hypothetical protein
VGDQHDGPTCSVKAEEYLHDLLGRLRVQISRGLVSEYQARIVHESARDGHTLLLPA